MKLQTLLVQLIPNCTASHGITYTYHLYSAWTCIAILEYKSFSCTRIDLQGTGKCEASFDFTGESSGELSFSQGEIIVTTEWVNEEWLMGKIGDREGMFPASFVKIITELPKKSSGKGAWHCMRALCSITS